MSKINIVYKLLITLTIILVIMITPINKIIGYDYNNMLIKERIRLENSKKAKFNYVFTRFKTYNKDIDSATVNKFIEVVERFNLDTSKKFLDTWISQLCLESGAKHRYRNGRLMISNANAIGITQTTPITTYHYLKFVLDDEHRKMFNDLGATNHDFIFNYKYNQGMTKEIGYEAKKWSSNVTNNLVLWGFIIKTILSDNGYDINRTLITYGYGTSGYKKYVNRGLDTNKNSYIVSINKIIEKFKS